MTKHIMNTIDCTDGVGGGASSVDELLHKHGGSNLKIAP